MGDALYVIKDMKEEKGKIDISVQLIAYCCFLSFLFYVKGWFKPVCFLFAQSEKIPSKL